jgi:cytochrome d ubiquinol oxidase subunit II
MSLADLPAILILVGLAAYAVLGGADFGAGFWQLWGGGGERDREIRDHAHHAMGPVWETNHVWLIFVLVVCWTGYPEAFGSIASTLSIPLFIAAIGVIMRGTAYALRSGTETAREQRRVEVAFGLSSILTPFALGTVIGGIASGRVPVGNAEGDLATSWLNETSIFIGVLSVVTGAYLAAVYLAADAARERKADLVSAFRLRAIGAGIVAGAVALAGLAVVHEDARKIWDGLTSGWGLAAVIVSAIAGMATLGLVLRSHFEPARATAALAVAAIIAGWGLAQRPEVLPGLTASDAAAGHSALVALAVALAIGAIVLVPSLVLLFGLFLRGRFDPGPEPITTLPPRPAKHEPLRPEVAALALGLLVAGGVLLFFFDSAWTHGLGVASLLAFLFVGFFAIAGAVADAAE